MSVPCREAATSPGRGLWRLQQEGEAPCSGQSAEPLLRRDCRGGGGWIGEHWEPQLRRQHSVAATPRLWSQTAWGPISALTRVHGGGPRRERVHPGPDPSSIKGG